MLIGLLAAIVAAIGYGTSSVLQAYGAQRAAAAAEARGAANHRTATGGPTLTSTIAAALTIWFVISTCLDVISFVAGVIAARQLPLFLSQTIINADLVVTALLGVLVLRIGLRRRDWLAISGLLIALVAVGAAAGGSGGNYAAPAGHWAVFLGSVLVLVCGQLVVRRLGSDGAVAAGLVSGLVFGALAIAVRIVNGLGPLQWHVLLSDPAAWTIMIAGAGGFYLHTVALQLGSVNGASAALVAGETIVPGSSECCGLATPSARGWPGWARSASSSPSPLRSRSQLLDRPALPNQTRKADLLAHRLRPSRALAVRLGLRYRRAEDSRARILRADNAPFERQLSVVARIL